MTNKKQIDLKDCRLEQHWMNWKVYFVFYNDNLIGTITTEFGGKSYFRGLQ